MGSSSASSTQSHSKQSKVHVNNLNDLLIKMEHLFHETNANIKSCNIELREEIATLREDVLQIKAECETKIVSLTDCVDEIRMDVRCNSERVAVCEKRNDLLLYGVPYSPSEDLLEIVRKISEVLGISEQNVPLVHARRLARAPISTGSTPPIAIQFAFKFVRDDFYRRYLASRDLSLSHLGFNEKKRIFLNENLTELGRKVKEAALKLKYRGKLQSVFTVDGCVYIKVAANSEAVPVQSLEQLPK